MPSVDKLAAEYKPRGLEVVLISFREDRELVARTVRERGYRARVLLDQTGDVSGRDYGVWGPPTVYLLDRGGRLLARGVGPHAWDSPAGRKLITAVLETTTR